MNNSKIKITFPDGQVKEFPAGISGVDILKTLPHRIQKEALGIKVNGLVKSLPESIDEDSEIKILTFEDEEGKDVFWHSSAHLMAHAIQRIYPETKFGIGPPIDDGFYYDIDLDHVLKPEDLEKIEKEMEQIVNEDHPILRKDWEKEAVVDYFKKKDGIDQA